jgi:hypothetical protein
MAEEIRSNAAAPVERRRFLRESLRGSLPLLFDWAAGRARQLAHLIQDAPSSRKTSSPPVAGDSAPAPVKESLDQRQDEFAGDNPDQSSYPST